MKLTHRRANYEAFGFMFERGHLGTAFGDPRPRLFWEIRLTVLGRSWVLRHDWKGGDADGD